ncbi:MAG: DUF1501 domain-containing protein [Proteobacteria bacterium]|nr:DUF1501 domain-containing protein [Pseudomonadota bacterium]
MNLSRRTVLAAGASAGLMTLGTRAWAAPGDARFVVVFLRGACDAANTLIPLHSPLYAEGRPRIAIPKSVAVPLGVDGWALHPALKNSMLPLWQRGELAFVPFAGIADNSRSHFETQERIERGGNEPGTPDPAGGFLGRLVAQVGQAKGGLAPVSFTEQLTSVWTGAGVAVPNVSLKGRKLRAARIDPAVADLYKGTRFESNIKEGMEAQSAAAMAAMDAKDHADEDNRINKGALNAASFELQAQRMARLLSDKYRLAFIDLGGWDTHVNQGGADGKLAGLLGGLGGGLAALARGLGPHWKSTTVVVISEFGRTFRENGNGGTDHGHGSAYWVLGGGIKGGKLYGEQVALTANTLHENRDWPVLTDYRALLGGLMRDTYGLNAGQLGAIFPGVKPVTWQLV